MDSSTPASGRSWNNGFFVAVGIAVLLIAAADAVLRVYDSSLSGNVENIEKYPAVLNSIAAHPSLVFMGNSLIGEGISLEAARQVKAGDDAQRVAKIVPDGSSIWDWACLEQVQFPQFQYKSTLVLGFAWSIADNTSLDVGRAFGNFCPMADAWTLSRQAGVGLDGFFEAIVVKTSRLYAMHDAVKDGLLRRLIPHYESVAQDLNSRQRMSQPAEDSVGTSPGEDLRFGRLAELVSGARAKNLDVILVAMPVLRPYEIDGQTRRAIDDLCLDFIDARQLVDFDRRSYLDTIHLTPESAEQFTAALMSRMSNMEPRSAVCETQL